MNRKLLAGLAAAGLLAGGGNATALAAAGAPAAARTAVVTSSTSKAADCGPLEPLVANGTITHAQAVSIRDAFISYVRAHWRSVVDTVLAQQVKNRTISKAQASAVNSAITQWVQKHRANGSGHYGLCHHVHG